MDLAIGIDVGGTRIKFGLVTKKGEVKTTGSVRTNADEGPVGLRDGLELVVRELKRRAHWKGWKIVAAGMGIPGTVTGRRGTMIMTPPQIQGLHGWETGTCLRQLSGVRTAVDNDATVAGLAEARIGAGHGAPTTILVTVGTGLGGALVVGGKLVRGRFGTGGEIGHSVFVPDGLPCGHGGRGCLELYTSATALVRIYRELGGLDADDPKAIVTKARTGHRKATRALQQIGKNLGLGLSAQASVVAPDLIVVGGGLSAAGRLLLDPARQAFKEQSLDYVSKGCRWVKARLGNRAGLIGAGLLAFEEGL
ncbi:MAG: glucokinase [Deltaproteobacteria bacterium]|nr:glucokinase [Deltaproteobacteria bacterium]